MRVGCNDEAVSYCNSKNRPALEAVGVVAVLVVVRASNTNAANESFFDNGVEEKDSREDKRWERMVVLPAPVSPL
jgi:hypothetical protein